MRLRAAVLTSALGAATVLSPALGQEWRGGKARVDGLVKNEKGEPIEGCKVSLRWGKSGRGGPDLKTDKKGRWAIFGLVGGPWDVDFAASGYMSKKISIELAEASRNPSIDVQLEPEVPSQAGPGEQAIMVAGKKVSKETAEAIEAGNAALNEKNWAGARENYVKALAELPDNGPLIQRIAAAYLAEGNDEEAIRYARMAADKNPEEFAPWRMIAEIELQRGNLDAGLAALEKVPSDKITDPQPYLNIGILLVNKKKPAEAEAAFDKALAVKGDLAEAYYYRGLARLHQRKNAGAKADLQKALELAPDGADAREIKELLKSLP
jgi:tetratricopeptide (TPR) repeat protein